MPGVRSDQSAIYLNDMYETTYDSFTEEPRKYSEIFKTVTARKSPGDKHTQLLKAGELERHSVEGQDIDFRSMVSGWSAYCRYWTYSDGLKFTMEAVDDVNTKKVGNLLNGLADSWGISLRYAKESMASRVFNRGGDLLGEWVFNGSHEGNEAPYGDMLYDNKPLFNLTGNTRTTKGGGTYYNSIASITLSPSTFEQLYNLFTVTIAFDEQDREIAIEPDTLLTESGAQAFLAKRILKSTRGMPSSELNDYNVYEGLCEPMAWRFLSDSSAFYVGKRKHKDFQFHERMMPNIEFFRDQNNRNSKVSIVSRFGVWLKVGSWRSWVKGGGSYA